MKPRFPIPKVALTQPAKQLAAIYGRVSTDKQDDSLELQESRTRKYAELKDLTVPATLIFADGDTSGGIPIMQRPGGQLLINRLKAGDVRHLIVAKLDRLGRNVRDGIGVLEFCQEQGITVHIVDMGGDSISTQNHIGRMILTMLMAVSEWERFEICDRTQKQMNNLFDQHKLTGNVPFGWDCHYQFPDGHTIVSAGALPAVDLAVLESQHGGRPSKRLVDNPAEQATIRWLANAARSGCKHIHLAADLNKRGLRTKLGGEWKAATVGSVLNNRYSRRLLESVTTHESEAQRAVPPPSVDLLPA